MSNKFNYRKSLNDIKASLFDIYENQEELIGIEKNPKKQEKRLNSFIEIKDIALMLLEGIEELYEDENLTNYSVVEDDIPDDEKTIEDSKLDDLVTKPVDESINEEIEEDNNIEESETEDEEVEDYETEDSDEDQEDDIQENSENDLPKYYLSCNEEDVNFAYVPKSIFDKMKENAIDIESSIENTEEESEDFEEDNDIDEEKDPNLYKQDDENPKGIIVRNDQYMKLALSKHRQENVIAEAKEFRIEAVNKKRREDQQKELEKAKVDINL